MGLGKVEGTKSGRTLVEKQEMVKQAMNEEELLEKHRLQKEYEDQRKLDEKKIQREQEEAERKAAAKELSQLIQSHRGILLPEAHFKAHERAGIPMANSRMYIGAKL